MSAARFRYAVTVTTPSGTRYRYVVATRAGKLKAAAVAGSVHGIRHGAEPIAGINVRRQARRFNRIPDDYWADDMVRPDDLYDPSEDDK